MPLTSVDFVASLVRFRYSLPGCSPPVRIRLERPAFGDFYFQAFNGSVSLSVAGYNYNSDWTPLLAGLSPAGMAASLAARSFATDPFRASIEQCPHCADSDHSRHELELTRCAKNGSSPAYSITSGPYFALGPTSFMSSRLKAAM